MKSVYLILSLLLVNNSFSQDDHVRFYSKPEIKFGYGKKLMFGAGGLMGLRNAEASGGLGFAYELVNVKMGGENRMVSTLPIILRSEVYTSSANMGFCTELGYGMGWLRNYEVRNNGYIGMGFSFVKGIGSIMFRRRFINIKNEKNINTNQIVLTLGIG